MIVVELTLLAGAVALIIASLIRRDAQGAMRSDLSEISEYVARTERSHEELAESLDQLARTLTTVKASGPETKATPTSRTLLSLVTRAIQDIDRCSMEIHYDKDSAAITVHRDGRLLREYSVRGSLHSVYVEEDAPAIEATA